jgi:hypothetical protein
VIQARAILAEQFGKITLAPVNDNGHLTYAAKGKVDLFAEHEHTLLPMV